MAYQTSDATRLVYEAAISSLALEDLRRNETQRPRLRVEPADVLRCALDCQTKYRELLACLAEGDFSHLSETAIASLLPNLYCIAERTASFAEAASRHLNVFPAHFRTALKVVLGELDTSAERILNAAEGWALALDRNFASQVKERLTKVARPRANKERRNWRDVLASVGD